MHTLLRMFAALALVAVFLLPASGRAEEATPAAPGPAATPSPGSAPPKPSFSADQIKEIKNALGLSLYLQGGYTYNLRSPDSGLNRLRLFDQKDNSFTVDLAEIIFDRTAPAAGGVGYHVKLAAGETAKFIHAAGLGTPDQPFDLTEAYLTAVAPVGKGLNFAFGKFVTMHGAEVIEASGDWNYSRSYLFNFAIPFTHTGLKVAYPVADWFQPSFYLVNGWDNFNDNNKDKTFGYAMTVKPFEPLTIVFNFMYGPEKDNNNHDQRQLYDVVITYKATKQLTFLANYDFAKEQNATPPTPVPGTTFSSSVGFSPTIWQGLAGYARYEFTDTIAVSVRGEWFDDRTGLRTAAVTANPGPQDDYEVTFTPEFKVYGLLIRPEYRHDWSDRAVFDDSHTVGTRKSQDTVAVGLLYTW